MKSIYKLPLIALGAVGLTLLTAGFSPATTAKAEETLPAKSAGLLSSSNQDINGTVTAKTATSLTVGGTTVAITDSTAITKGGEAIKLDGLQVGDHVKVVATPMAGGALRAVSVEVVTKKSGMGPD